MPIVLTQYKALRSTDGAAFEATIHLDGKKVGFVMNSGTGGPNTYDFTPPAAREACEAEARAWATRTGQNPDYPEILDLYLEDLHHEQDLQAIADRNGKRGFPITVVLQNQKADWADPPFYAEESTVGVRDEAAIATALAKYRPEAHRVLHARTTEPPRQTARPKRR